MTELLRQVLADTSKLAPDAQDELARLIMDLTIGSASLPAVSDEEYASMKTSLAQADRREFASDEAVAQLWRTYGL